MSVTTISWTQQTWNPLRGCSPVSPGCKNCYAERQGGRFAGPGRPFDGFIQIGRNGKPGPHWTGKVELIPHMLDVPLRRRIPTAYFVNSMSDLFHENLPVKDRRLVFDAMREAPQHTYQILTKRADIMRDFCQWWVMQHADQMPSNWWMGVSVEDQQRKDRIAMLRDTPATVRFISFEPLLEDLGELDLRGIDQAIWGGESGPGARPCNTEWIRRGMAQATRDGCLNFVKQLGANVIQGGERRRKKDRKGADMDEWEHDLRIREKPEMAHTGGPNA